MNETDFNFDGDLAPLYWTIIIFFAVLASVAIILGGMYIYYSWIRRDNSLNMDGRQLTEKIFEKTGTKVSVIRSFFYIKYWNYNKSAGTHRLRPWTTDRRSLWTMMEAAQQAYSTVIRKEKGKTFWLLFRIPFIFRFLGSILAGLFIYLGITSGDKDAINALWLIISFVILFIFYWIADAGKLYVLWKNVYPMIESIGFTKEELKAVKRIYLIRMIYATLMVIYEIIKLALKIAQKVAKEKK